MIESPWIFRRPRCLSQVIMVAVFNCTKGPMLADTVGKLFYRQSKKFLSVSNKFLYFRYVGA